MQAYIGNDGIVYRQLIAPRSITIIRAEGRTDLCGIKQVCQSFAAADAILIANSATAPEHGGYDKHDFKVEYMDGYIYEGRYDLMHLNCERPDLAKHMRSYLEYLAFDEEAASYIEPSLRKSAQSFLLVYDVQQKPVRVEPNETAEIIRDYRNPTPKNRM
ncbi:MAG: hypothetical protein MUC87_06870 [Bacteroidia bacterium]|jgi:hypothetical protein|nr:hypothetical protein [Bacteroidia bacterium]